MTKSECWEERAARIRAAVRRVPRGHVATYGDIAEAAGENVTARQAGRALRAAGGAAQLPWHRIVAAGGRIALPGDSGLEQRLRLQAEGVPFSGRRVRISECRWDGKKDR